MNKDQIIGIVRHVLTFGGGFLVAKGVTDAASLNEIIGGLITVIGGIWSILAKKKAPDGQPVA